MRAFVAVEISDQKAIASIMAFQNNVKIDARFVECDKLHFTLKFLGEISESMIQEIIKALKTIKFSEFDVRMVGVNVFEGPGSLRTVWIEAEQKSGKLVTELAEKVENALGPLGFAPESQFIPHVTAFIVKNKSADIAGELMGKKDMEFGVQTVTEIILKESRQVSHGTAYLNLSEVKAV